MRKETFRNTRKAIVGLTIVSGIALMTYPVIDAITINSPEDKQKRVEQLFPDYHPEQFQANQQIIVDFSEQAKDLIMKGAKTIEVPENVTQAGTFIQREQKLHDESTTLYTKMERDQDKRLTIETLSGGVLAMLGIIEIARQIVSSRSTGKENYLIVQRIKTK